MKLLVQHRTVYRYDERVAHSTQYLRLTPADSARQHVLDWQLGLPARAVRSRDAFGNWLHTLTLDHPHHEILIQANGTVETRDGPAIETDPASPLPYLRHTPLTMPDRAIRQFAAPFAELVGREPATGLEAMLHALLDAMPYLPGRTDATTPAAAAFAAGAGVCQDHAQVYVAACRSLGVPARYVSGYLYAEDQPEVASHAWAEVRIGDDWHGLDPSNGCQADGRYLKLSVGMDYLDACPVRGVRIGGGGERLDSDAWVGQSLQQQQQ
ncbi:transglutaminase [Laribacter hongkongensis]|uniref:transglutaminase family protein n=1 Tax=Laribacter hongkongensis TaxID=168471 RepID=UPI001878DC21|nr:transglutaminase family protein [Laribacter hongkongensis]MBE5527993.1 transglutaminase [Laribacter hongkongensis]